MQNQSNCGITFDPRLKRALYLVCYITLENGTCIFFRRTTGRLRYRRMGARREGGAVVDDPEGTLSIIKNLNYHIMILKTCFNRMSTRHFRFIPKSRSLSMLIFAPFLRKFSSCRSYANAENTE